MARSSNSTQTLSPGNIVSGSLRLYGANWRSYLSVALTAILWGALPFVTFLVIFALTAATPIAGILFLPWIALLLYCIAQAGMQSAVISRLAYGEFTERPETIANARLALKPKLRQFLSLAVLMSLISIGISFLTSFLQLIPFIGFLASIAVSLWFQARLFMPEVFLGIEETTDASKAVQRTWQLSKDAVLPIILTILVATLVSIPFFLVAFIPMIVGGIPLLGQSFINLSSDEVAALLQPFLIALAISVLLFFVVSIFTVPFWQIIKSLVYIDLRSRREGLGLELGDRNPNA